MERHKDNLDDGRDGYNLTSVLSLDGISMSGGIYRLSIIFYLRNAVGSFMEKEYWNPANTHAVDVIRRYQEKVANYQEKYDDFVLNPNECNDNLEIQKGKSARFRGIKLHTFIERDAYHSTIAYPILQMRAVSRAFLSVKI